MVFVSKKERAKPEGYPLGYIFGRNPVKGDIGIEIEVEGKKLPKQDVGGAWRYDQDGSLRGEDNAEYILAQPIPFSEVPAAIDYLWRKFADSKSVIDDSNRTSVHVHLNCQGFHLNRLAAFCGLYFCLEEVLTEWCGDHRVGNLFCLRAKDAPGIIRKIKTFIQSDGSSGITDNLHYSGFNVHALTKFGSIEVRTLRGVKDPDVILDWVSILERLYKLSAEYPDPRDVCTGFSGEGPLAFFERLLGDKTSVVRRGINMSDEDIRESMYSGIRLAQDLCYCRDWSLYNPVEVKIDPFGRGKRKTSGEDAILAAMTAPTTLQQGWGSLSTSPSPVIPPNDAYYLNQIENPFPPVPEYYEEDY